jgi:hypothetical protein
MDLTPTSLCNDPSQFLYAFDFKLNVAQILEMPRASFDRSIFLDGRIDRGKREMARVTIPQLLAVAGSIDPAKRFCGYIFHIAQCGSTLLARALDGAHRSLSLREPYALRQLGVIGAGGDRAGFNEPLHGPLDELIRLALVMYGKRWEAAAPVIVKANVPVNFIADKVLALTPEAPAIVLYFGLQEYLGAVLRTEGHERWVETVYQELDLDSRHLISHNLPQCTAERAAALWFVQMQAFDLLLKKYPNVRSLDAVQFLAEPVQAIVAAANLMGVALSPDEAHGLVASDLFATYSKNPTLDYDAEVRIARSRQTFERKAAEIERAFTWVQNLPDKASLPTELERPLSGRSIPLLGR